MHDHLKKSLELTIRDVLRRYPEVDAAYLFGSFGDDRARRDSDIDLALLGDGAAINQIVPDLLCDFVKAGLERVDLCIFDEASLLLRFEAIRRNCLIYRRSPDVDTASVFSRTLREFWDFRPYLLRRATIYREKVLHGTS